MVWHQNAVFFFVIIEKIVWNAMALDANAILYIHATQRGQILRSSQLFWRNLDDTTDCADNDESNGMLPFTIGLRIHVPFPVSTHRNVRDSLAEIIRAVIW